MAPPTELEHRLVEMLGQESRDPSPADVVFLSLGPNDVADAVSILESLARSGPSARVRANAVAALPAVALRAAARPEPLARFRALALELARDPESLVRVAAAVKLAEVAGEEELRALRKSLAPLLPDLEAAAGDPAVARAHRALQGPSASVEFLSRVGSQPAGSAISDDDLLPLLEELPRLEREPVSSARPACARLFLRLPVVHEKRKPIRSTMPGVGAVYDPDASLALLTVRAWAASTSPAQAAESVDFLSHAAPELLEVIIGVLPQLGDTGAAIAGAVASASGMYKRVREAALFTLDGLAGHGGTAGAIALDRLTGLCADPILGGAAKAALQNHGRP